MKVNDVERDIYPKEDKGMSEIVIRHAETRDYEAIRQIHAQPEVYCNTLQVPHPSGGEDGGSVVFPPVLVQMLDLTQQ